MRTDQKQKGLSTLQMAATVTAVAIALAAVSAALATREDSDAASTAAGAQRSYQDPSLAGLSVSPDAEPGHDIEAF